MLKPGQIPLRCDYREPAPLRDRRARVWIESLERQRAALGARPATIHIELPHWLARFRAGATPACALLEELTHVSD